MEQIRNRSEILFLYDVKDANPNGDPVDENKPRIDEETGINIVTDVRLKRTIRDYLYEHKGLEVFVRQEYDEKGILKTKEDRSKIFGEDDKKIISECIDIRLFGATTAIKQKTMTLTGPVQFKFGRSLHPVNLKFFKGTTVMPSRADVKQGTFWERYILPYSFIAFYGIVNENAAKMQNIPLTENDIDLMLEAIWHGTKNLISGSKFGQMPRLLLHVVYKVDKNFHIGELDKFVNLKTNIEPTEIRDISDFKIDVTPLVKVLSQNSDKIEKIRYKKDDRLKLIFEDFDTDLESLLKFTNTEVLNF